MTSQQKEVKVIAAVPETLRNGVYARLRLQGTTFKQWLNAQMEAFMAETPLQDGHGNSLPPRRNARTERAISH